jgi:acetamidase/formamidase
MSIALARSAGTNTHVLRSGPKTVHWGFFDGALDPVLTIDSGDCVVIECVSGNPEWMPPKSSGFEVLPELRQIHEQVKRGTGNHILTGPISVRGAAVGDVLEIRILEIELRQNWGYNLFRAYGGTLPDEFPYYRIIHVALDRERNRAILPSGITVPVRPFFGQLGVAPPKAFGRQNSKEPREFGGNIDCKELTAGSTIYLPVCNDGALFSTGDGHAAQGDGELTGDALETSMDVEFTVNLIQGRSTGGPRAENDEYIMAMGIANSLPDAVRQATTQLARWIERDYHLTANESAIVLGSAMRYDIAELVDPQVNIVAKLSKTVLAGLAK